ncbi:MAG: hypothetical protein ACR2JK_04310 [Geodermatophilaceae bacterium]
MTPRLGTAMLLVAVVGTLAAGLGLGVRGSADGYAAVDEPQYLLTALSLYEDGSLDIADELAERRWVEFHTPGELPVQTEILDDGRQVSPHDPLLPLLLALPMGLGGVVAAKLTLAFLAGAVAASTLWIAVRRLDVAPTVAISGVALAAVSAPLAVYGQQVYPEIPAALAVLAAVAALTGPLRRRGIALLVVAVVALPWLSVKYVPVAVALALLGVVLLVRRRTIRYAGALVGALALAGAAYLMLHRISYGGWTVYAAGDHFQGSGEFGVIGFDPNYPGRSIRIMGLLIDRDFGLASWQPAWLLLVPAAAMMLVRRRPQWTVLLGTLAVGWFTATYIALTMHGFWWPGRQLVVVLPVAVLVILCWAAELSNRIRLVIAAVAAYGGLIYAVVLWRGWAGDATWVQAPDRIGLHSPLAWLFPDDRVLAGTDVVLYALWSAAAVLVVVSCGYDVMMHRHGRTNADRHAPTEAVSRTQR